ncbi:hypothetical protein [Dolichospermum compactum]|uniref:hypothetical protein n=1 Tax=Dolichospermum compactum TaxID=136073 RepID=UPI0015607133|nr:hypothetical protein [Dolichospermum compactum]
MQQRFAIAYQYFLVLVQNTTLNGDKNQKKPIVTPGGAECGINTAWQWGANLIHIAACHPTQTGIAPDLPVQSNNAKTIICYPSGF